MNDGRRQRVPYFDRPKHPRDWRYWVGGTGKVLITLGLLMFGFVGYQLWGTGLQTAQAQDDLENAWQEKLSATTTTVDVTTTTTVPDSVDPSSTTIATTTTLPVAEATPPIPNGEVVGRMRIPSIGLDWWVVEGVRVDDLKKGPGHFRESVMPGQLGNAAIAGHRTTYGAPFGDLDAVQPGDLITVETLAGVYTYRVTGSEIVSPADYIKVVPTVDPTKATLTLATCHPEYTARERLIVYSELVPEESGQVFQPPTATVPATTAVPETLPGEEQPDDTVPADTAPDGTTPTTEPAPADTVPTTTEVDPAFAVDEIEDTFSQGWFDDTPAIPHVLGWGLVLALIAVGSYYLGKLARRLWVSFLVATVPFIVALYFFYENVNRLLPPGL